MVIWLILSNFVAMSEQWLIDNGFTQMFFNGKEWTTKKHHTYPSTMGHLTCLLVKDGVEVVYGLNERGLPPTWISPRPLVNFEHNGGVWHRHMSDNECNALMQRLTDEDFFNLMFTKTIEL